MPQPYTSTRAAQVVGTDPYARNVPRRVCSERRDGVCMRHRTRGDAYRQGHSARPSHNILQHTRAPWGCATSSQRATSRMQHNTQRRSALTRRRPCASWTRTTWSPTSGTRTGTRNSHDRYVAFKRPLCDRYTTLYDRFTTAQLDDPRQGRPRDPLPRLQRARCAPCRWAVPRPPFALFHGKGAVSQP
jgi:hypothetical protein